MCVHCLHTQHVRYASPVSMRVYVHTCINIR